MPYASYPRRLRRHLSACHRRRADLAGSCRNAADARRSAAKVGLVPGPDQPGADPRCASADPKSKEEKRFARADKDEDGRITLAELVEPRRKAYAKLDLDQDGKLSFEEWAVKTIDKFKDADADESSALTPAEYATTAPKPKAKPACACS